MDSLSDQTSLAGSQTEDLLTVTELLDSSKPFLNTDPEGLRCLLQGDRPSLGFSSEDEIKDSPEPEREALPFLPQHCHKFLPTQSVPTDVKQESCFLLVNDAGSPESSGDVASEDLTKPFPTKHTSVTGSLRTQSDTSDIDTIVGPVADLYIHEGDTHDFILSRTDGPRETACPEYQPGADSYPHVLMCDPEVTQCHLGFGEAQVLQNVSQMSQHQELQPPAADATSLIDLMSVSDVRLDDDVSSSPVELWVDACQCLMGEDKEEQVVLDAADCSMMQGHQESGYNLDESKELGCSSDVIRDRGPPVERWSSVDSWASALSHWTGIIEDPSEDIAAAFAEIGAEIDALTQSLDELNAKTELEEDLKTTVQEIMGVQDQPLKTKTVPESSSHSDQRCLSLCPEAAGPGLLNVGRSRGIESVYDTTKVDQKLPPMGSLRVAVVASGGHTKDVSLICASFYDGDLETFEEDVCINKEDYPVTLKITEDMDLIPQTKLFDEETFGDGVCPLTDASSQQRSDESPTGASDSDLHTNESFQNFPDLLEERQLASPDSIMCLAPLGIDSSGVCQTNSCLKGDQSQNTSDHVQHRPPHPASDGITDQPFLESEEELIQKKQKTINTAEESSPDGLKEQNSEKSCFLVDLSGDLANYPPFSTDFIVVSETDPVAYITLGLNDPFIPWAAKPFFTGSEELKMPHKTTKNPAESKTRSKKDKPGHHHITQPKKQDSHHVCIQESCKQQESHPPTGEHRISELHEAGAEVKEDKPVNETGVEVTEKGLSKPHGKKKKKHVATVKIEDETPVDPGGGAKPKSTKGRVDIVEAKLGTKTGTAQPVAAQKKSKQPDDKIPQGEKAHTDHKDHSAKTFTASANDDSVKRRRMSGDKCGKILCSLESKLPKTGGLIKTKEESQGSAARKKAYSEVVKEKIPPKEEPQVVQVIQAVPVSEDPQSLRLCCQFAAVHSDCTVTWSKEGLALIQIKRSAGDDNRVSLTITNASHKDLGRYECQLSCSHGSASLGYLLTYEVLSEIVIPASPRSVTSPSAEVSREEEDAHYSKLHFKEDFLSDQYFGENLPISILTEKVHFGEGMHRRAFRTTLKEGQVPLLVPGHSCVLKVHNAISYGTKNNDELIQRNFSLAVEECQVQNTAREYIKAYTSAARSVEAFGDIPEIIPIYLVHRPSNDIPYATLEEELIGDFVKYSVKDGKEINLMRRDSEAGQKCCAFQHWVYQNTEGNLLVTDMQGVGMKLTDVGIATCKKGYKGFKGNCATSFIDQFKVLHQCNSFCEILGLRSLQPKAKKTSAAPKPKAQPSAVPKKKTFGPTAKGKS